MYNLFYLYNNFIYNNYFIYIIILFNSFVSHCKNIHFNIIKLIYFLSKDILTYLSNIHTKQFLYSYINDNFNFLVCYIESAVLNFKDLTFHLNSMIKNRYIKFIKIKRYLNF